MLPTEIVAKKAELINHGKIHIPRQITLPFYPSRSTAGPGAGKRAMVFGFHGTRVKLALVPENESIFTLVKRINDAKRTTETTGNQHLAGENNIKQDRPCILGNNYMIFKNNEPFLEEVSLEPTLMHAPNQAFINITTDCIYNCSFCVTPDLEKGVKGCSVERWIELILAHSKNSNLESVSVTSGVAESPHKTVLEMGKIIKAVRDKLPEIPIGVEPYLNANEDVDLLFTAGANEIKLNLETPKQEIFDKICPGMDYSGIHSALKYAVQIFGKNKVCSNLIIGMGETDDEILQKVEELAKIGVVATLRALRVNELNIPKLIKTLGFEPEPVSVERLLSLAERQKQILDKYNLTTCEFKTMCHRCKSCDIVPQQDI